MAKLLVSFIVSILIVGTTIPAYADNGISDPGDVGPQVLEGSLSNSFTKTLTGGGHVVDGVGLTASATDTFSITLPAGASVDMALLYWDVMGSQADTVEFESTDVLPGLTTFGTVADPCWPGVTTTTSYRADVTSLVPGTGVYDIEIAKAAEQNDVLGAALVVIFKDNSASTVTTLLVDDGHIVRTAFEVMSHTMSGFTVGAPIAASTSYIIGDSQSVATDSDETFETTVVGNASDENAGPRFHTNTADVLADVFAGMTTADLTVESGNDCITWIAQVFEFTVQRVAVGGEFLGVDTTAVLVAGSQNTAAWMIPVIVSGIGFAIVIARKF